MSTKMDEYKEIVENRRARVSYQRMKMRAMRGKRAMRIKTICNTLKCISSLKEVHIAHHHRITRMRTIKKKKSMTMRSLRRFWKRRKTDRALYLLLFKFASLISTKMEEYKANVARRRSFANKKRIRVWKKKRSMTMRQEKKTMHLFRKLKKTDRQIYLLLSKIASLFSTNMEESKAGVARQKALAKKKYRTFWWALKRKRSTKDIWRIIQNNNMAVMNVQIWSLLLDPGRIKLDTSYYGVRKCQPGEALFSPINWKFLMLIFILIFLGDLWVPPQPARCHDILLLLHRPLQQAH